MENVYHLGRGLNKVSDEIINLTYRRGRIIMPVLFGFGGIKNFKNSRFNNLERECGLEHFFVHGENAVEAVLYLIFMVSNIRQLFLVRRLRNHFTTQRKIVRLLLKGLYLLKYRINSFLAAHRN